MYLHGLPLLYYICLLAYKKCELARKPISVITFLNYTGSVQNEYHYICLLAYKKCELTTVVAPTITKGVEGGKNNNYKKILQTLIHK